MYTALSSFDEISFVFFFKHRVDRRRIKMKKITEAFTNWKRKKEEEEVAEAL
jgi:hypothetical protein